MARVTKVVHKMLKGKVFCFGELLLRFSPESNEWFRENDMPVYVGGAELNVATALAKWELHVKYCTSLPDNFLSEDILEYLLNNDIDISSILLSGGRIGIYYLQQGSDLKNAGLIYDRSNSSFSELKPGMIDWEKVLKNVSWFHFSAISPAITENIFELCGEALRVASKMGITISIDLNYRAKLWKYGKNPKEVMPELVKYCDVVMGNIWSANTLLGIKLDEHIHDKKSKQAYLDHAFQTSDAIRKQFPKCGVVANTFRFDNQAGGVFYYSTLLTGEKIYHSAEFNCDSVVDKIGTGDCFMAGLIYGMYQELPPEEIINYASAAAFGKLQEIGDATAQSVDQVKALVK